MRLTKPRYFTLPTRQGFLTTAATYQHANSLRATAQVHELQTDVPCVDGPDSSSRDVMIDLADIAPAFSFVMGKGLVPSDVDHEPQQFGNAALVMVGAPFSLRFERDRGQVFVDVGSSAAGWHKLEDVLVFVDNSVAQQPLGEPPDPVAMANLLQSKWDLVVSLFGDQQRISQLRAFAKQRSAALLGKLFRKP